MSDTDLLTLDAHTGEVLQALTLRDAPPAVLAAAQQAATALQQVIARKKKPVIFNGEQYLEFEDWQTVGRFYGVTAKALAVEPVDLGTVQGFKAVAIALSADGHALSQATAYCMADEPNWRGKPIFQLASMAQTRACAKALRNVLAWVVVLAGYRPTPAEELTGDERAVGRPARPAPRAEAPPLRPEREWPAQRKDEQTITDKQQKRFFAVAKEHGWTHDDLRGFLTGHGLMQSNQILVREYDALVDQLKAGPPALDADLTEGDIF